MAEGDRFVGMNKFGEGFELYNLNDTPQYSIDYVEGVED